jgi:hypothetical protein
MRRHSVTQPPYSLRRRRVSLDNIALVPASLLPDKVRWQAVANGLPRGEMLIILPSHTKQQRVVRFVACHLREKGKYVKIMDKELALNEP